jgi:Zn-finger nucleic acid-binding protein
MAYGMLGEVRHLDPAPHSIMAQYAPWALLPQNGHAHPGVPIMMCPRCPSATLITIDRDGLEIETCPTCRGVWLDRGELDKLVERSLRTPPSPALERRDGDRRERYGDDSSSYHRSDRRSDGGRRRSSWLSELFD